MLGLITIWGSEEMGEVHAANVLEYLENVPSQSFISGLIFICLILSI